MLVPCLGKSNSRLEEVVQRFLRKLLTVAGDVLLLEAPNETNKVLGCQGLY